MDALLLERTEDKVILKTSIGIIKGVWKSDEIPQKKMYDIEIDSDEIISVDKIKLKKEFTTKILCDDSGITIKGFVEEIEENVMYLRLMNDLVMFEIDMMGAFQIYLKQYVCIRLQEINIFDAGLY